MTFDKWYSERLGLTVEEALKTPAYNICKASWKAGHIDGFCEGEDRGREYGYGSCRHALDMD